MSSRFELKQLNGQVIPRFRSDIKINVKNSENAKKVTQTATRNSMIQICKKRLTLENLANFIGWF